MTKWIKDKLEGMDMGGVKSDKELEERDSRTRSIRSAFSGNRRASSIWGGTSINSDDRLSAREVGKIKRMVVEKDKEERKGNITIKGMSTKEECKVGKAEIEKMLKEKLGVECVIESCRLSGTVIIPKVNSMEKKLE